jgi:AcrR family transcriptional regulator
VEDVTSAVGIAKGTFYSFFPSKERFIYAMMTEGRQELMDLLAQLREEHGRLGRDEMRTWLRAMWRSERSIYRLVTLADYEWLMARLEPRASFDPGKDAQVMEAIAAQLDGVREGCDWFVFANLQKTLALALLGRENLHPQALEATVDALIEAMLNEVFGRCD